MKRSILTDILWAAMMFRIRRRRRELLFSSRNRFDKELRPKIGEGDVIDYPDAVYHMGWNDFLRASKSIAGGVHD